MESQEERKEQKGVQKHLQKIVKKHKKVFPLALHELKKRNENGVVAEMPSLPSLPNEPSFTDLPVSPPFTQTSSPSTAHSAEDVDIANALIELFDLQKTHFPNLQGPQFLQESQTALHYVNKVDKIKRMLAIGGSVVTLLGIVFTTYFNVEKKK